MSTTVEAELREAIGAMQERIDGLARAGLEERAAPLARLPFDYMALLGRLGEVADPALREELRRAMEGQFCEAQQLGSVPRTPTLRPGASRDDIRRRIHEIVKGPAPAVFATVDAHGTPWSRYVFAAGDEHLNVAFTTSVTARKCSHVMANPRVHLSFKGAVDSDIEYVQIAGYARLLTDAASKRQIWSPLLWLYTTGPDDPAWAVIAVQPLRAELWDLVSVKLGRQPFVWEPDA